jgi:hypothetical protein
MPQALYYPWIDIRDQGWLKTALLYWDSVRTIVPESIDAPYSTDTGRILQKFGFLVPLRVHSTMDEIEDLTVDVLAYLESPEGAELLIDGRGDRRRDIHVEKLSHELRRLVDIHPEKLPNEIRHILQHVASPSGRDRDWLPVDEKFADFYMTLLATRLSERLGARLLTSLAAADRLAVTARFDANLNRVLCGYRHHWYRHEYEAYGPRCRMPRHLAPGMLANLAIERIGVAPDTPVDRLIEFREKHRDELAQFRTKIEQLAASVEADLTAEALRQRVTDIYTGEVSPAISNLKAALTGCRIKFLCDGLLKIAFLSAASSTMLINAGLSVPTALLAGANISLIATEIMYNIDKKKSLRENPFAYLFSMERELTRRKIA